MARLVLKVSLNLAEDPPVLISDPRAVARGKNRIRWVRDDDTLDFEFLRLNELDQAYFNRQSINLNRTRINCRNRAPDSDPKVDYVYEIVVRYNGNNYKSTAPGAPPGGRPVIRN